MVYNAAIMDVAHKKILVTGGSGFIGSNLAHRLVSLKAAVTLLVHTDSGIALIKDIVATAEKNKIPFSIVTGDIRDQTFMDTVVKDKEIIFNLAAKVSHMDKGVVSYEDLDVNCRGQLTLLEACRVHNPKVKIVFSSTRMVYSSNVTSPITETAATDPLTLYGIHKLTAEKYHLAYYHRYGIRSTILRIGNPYGDRQHFSKGLYSLPGWFMNRAMKGETIEILSDGTQIRDYTYIEDLVEIMIRVALSEKTNGEIYNCGNGSRHTFGEMVSAIATTVGKNAFVYAKNPSSGAIDSYYYDVSKLTKAIDWQAQTDLVTGMKRMYEFAKAHPSLS